MVATDISRLLGLLRLDTSLIADSREDTMQQSIIPRSRHGHRDGKDGSIAITSYTMKCFVPPLELRYLQMVDSGRGVHHQAHLFF